MDVQTPVVERVARIVNAGFDTGGRAHRVDTQAIATQLGIPERLVWRACRVLIGARAIDVAQAIGVRSPSMPLAWETGSYTPTPARVEALRTYYRRNVKITALRRAVKTERAPGRPVGGGYPGGRGR